MKALIISKITSLEHYHRKTHLQGDALLHELSSQGIPARELATSDAIHQRTLHKVEETLLDMGVKYSLHSTEKKDISLKDVDLLIAVGGDGTLLTSSHLIRGKTPLLGVNSDPKRSKGYLSCCSEKDVAAMIHAFFQGKARLESLSRLNVKITGVSDIPLALNDVFVCGLRPFDTVKYQMKVGKISARHADSGLLMCTGAGSTAWTYNAARMYPADVARILALSGHKYPYTKIKQITDSYNQELPFACDEKKMRYYARDIILGGTSSAKLHAGFTSSVCLSSLMYEGNIVIDNKYVFDFSHGKRAIVKLVPDSLRMVRV